MDQGRGGAVAAPGDAPSAPVHSGKGERVAVGNAEAASAGNSSDNERKLAVSVGAAGSSSPPPVRRASLPPPSPTPLSDSAAPPPLSLVATAPAVSADLPPVPAELPPPLPPPSRPPELVHNRVLSLEALVNASNALNATLDPNKVADILVTRTAALLEVAGVSVMMVNERNDVRIAAAHGLSESYVQSQAGPLEQSIAGRALVEQRTFATWDLRQSTDTTLAEAARREGIVSVACAPMYFNGRAVGALNAYCREPRCFTDDHFHMLSLLAAQGAIALTNARAYRELRAQAAEVRAGFQRVGEALSASLDIGETLRLIVQLAVEMTRVDAGALFMLLDKHEGGGFALAGMRGLDRRSVRRFRRMPISRLAQRALDERRVVIVPDTRRVTDVAFPTLRLSIDETAEARSYVCVPILLGDRPLGVLEQYASEPGRFTKSDIQLLSSFAHQASVAIENARLYAQERNTAQTLQRAFLPELPGAISGFQIGRIYAPGSQESAVGGDTYDLFQLPDGRIAALIADVCGQGTLAATLAVMAKYTVRAYALESPDPSIVLARTNEALLHQTGDSTFLTLCYALLNPERRTVTIASAAHPPALLCRVQEGLPVCSAVENAPGLIAGFLPNQEYENVTLAMQAGDVLVFYTDGVIEARQNKVMFGQQRLEEVIAANANLSAQDIAGAIYNSVTDYVEGDRPDDIALLVLKAE